MGLLGGLFGGGKTTSTENYNQTQNTSQQQQATGSTDQSQELSALSKALQSLSGGGAQQMQYGFAPIGETTKYMQALLGQQTGLGPTYSGAYGDIQGYQSPFAQQAFRPTESTQYNDAMQAANEWAARNYNRTTFPTVQTMANKTGMVGSTPWAQKLTQGSSDLAANLGAQGLNYASAIQGMGTQGLMGTFNPLASLAGGNVNTGLGLIQTDPKAVAMGTTQQYGQTGQSEQTALSNLIANMFSQSQGSSTGQTNTTGSSTKTTQTDASPMGALGSILKLGSSIFGGPIGGLLSGALGGLLGGGSEGTTNLTAPSSGSWAAPKTFFG